ncbi:RIMS-binding protein 3-like [Gallus gallus]|uniref:RIMS-binding protein 3-like n=1 Tax=Gallus gallus TaxID=9031 RepID=UPI001AE6E9F4|nr:RIMS-binding protein 3-like [Gallus gallus]
MLWDTVGQGQAKRSRPPHHRGPAQLPASPAQREEHRQEQEALRAQLEGERLRSQELLRCHTAKRRELQEVAQRERQLLADRLRCAWEKQQALEEQQLKEREQRQRATETRQLLRWKEAELHATKELLQRECDAALRQARELQQLLAQELRSPHRSSRMARPQLQDVLSKLRWETDGEQPACIRHLQHQLELERRLFSQYIVGSWEGKPQHVESRAMSCSQDRERALGRHCAEQGSSRPAVKDAHVQVPETAKEDLGLPGSRPSPHRGLAQPPICPVQREEKSQVLKALQAQLQGERLRSQELQRRWAAERCELQEAADRERQLLANRLRSKWERERASKLQRLWEQSQRQRDAEIRQLLQAKEAQLRQMQERLQKQRNDTIRQAWHLQRQLVEELLKGGSSRRERGIHQEVQRQLCWKPRGEQAAHVLRLQRELQEQRRGFLQYILQHGEGQPPVSCNGARACHRAVAEVGVQAEEQQEPCPPERMELQEQNAHLLRGLKDLQRQGRLLGKEKSALSHCLLREGRPPEVGQELQRLQQAGAKLGVLSERLQDKFRQLQDIGRELRPQGNPQQQWKAQHCLLREECPPDECQELQRLQQAGAILAILSNQLGEKCRQLQIGRKLRPQGNPKMQWKAQHCLLREEGPPEEGQELQRLQQAGAKLGVLRERLQVICRQLQDIGRKLRPCGNPKQQWKAQHCLLREECPPEECQELQRLQQACAKLGVLSDQLQEKCRQFQIGRRLRPHGNPQQQWMAQPCLQREEHPPEECQKLQRLQQSGAKLAVLSDQLEEKCRQLQIVRKLRTQRNPKKQWKAQPCLLRVEGFTEECQELQRLQQSGTILEVLRERLQVICRQLQIGRKLRPQGNPIQQWKAQPCLLRVEGPPEHCQEQQRLLQAGAKLVILSDQLEEKCRRLQEIGRKLRPHGKQECSNPRQRLDELQVWLVAACNLHCCSETSPLIRRFLARHSYNPFEGPNQDPENKLPLTAGQYVYVFGDMDEDGWLLGELMDGTRGLVPSSLVEEVSDDDLDTTVPPELRDLLLDTDDEERAGSRSNGRK